MKRRSRYTLVVAVTSAVLAMLAVHFVAEWWRRAPPNYSRIEDGLYLGGRVAQPPPGTRAVLNLCEAEDSYRAEVHRWQPIPDAEPAPSIDWLRRQVQFIDEQRRAGRPVFVHCHAGVSRGGMVTVAYLMWQHGWSRDEALEFVRTRREVVRPNPAFMALLLEWEQALKAESTGSFGGGALFAMPALWSGFPSSPEGDIPGFGCGFDIDT